MPVLEALRDERLAVAKVVMAGNVHGSSVDDIIAAAHRRGVRVDRASADQVTRISRNGRHDQGVVADVEAPGVVELGDWLAVHQLSGMGNVLVLDGITNPANVGLVLRTAAAFGFATVLPRLGVPGLGPLVVKASAGVAFFATVLRAPTAMQATAALAQAGARVVGLAADSAEPVFHPLPHPTVFVLGGETNGVSGVVADQVAEWRAIPMAVGVESLNVAVAAGIVCAEAVRQRDQALGAWSRTIESSSAPRRQGQ